MVGEAGELNVVLDVDFKELVGKAARTVLLAFVGKRAGFGAEVGVEVSGEALVPGSSHGSGIFVHHRIDDSLEGRFELVVVVALGSVVEAGVGRLWNRSVAVDHIKQVGAGSALGEVERAVQTDVLLGLVLVDLAHCVHLREVDGRLTHPHQFRFEESGGRIAPAGSRAPLVFDRSRLEVVDGREFKGLAVAGSVA